MDSQLSLVDLYGTTFNTENMATKCHNLCTICLIILCN